MTQASICLKPVNDLLQERFYVPSYQRGYRWTERQVVELLNDLWEFQSGTTNSDPEAFYCLQPIVVKKRVTGDWELIDGQQRLTTIFLILTALKPLLDVLGKTRFTLHFETRSDTSEVFLRNIDPALRDENIDYHHICNAYDAITKWFEGRDGNHKIRFLQCLLNDDQLGSNVRVIWYELPEIEDPVEAFTRLNVGKIPLTNAELIRALFLRSANFPPDVSTVQQLRIAQEWDNIEKVLQRDDVWYFLHRSTGSPANRIEHVFQLIARESSGQSDASDPHYTFHFYNERFSKTGTKADDEWLTVSQHFMTLEEWFTDRTLYHLIGFLVNEGDDLLAIRKLGRNAGKHDFQAVLRHRILRRFIGSAASAEIAPAELKRHVGAMIDDLEYPQDSQKIRSALLLFNIITLLENRTSNLRFPFDSYKKENWDIEHVRSVQAGKPSGGKQRKEWLANVGAHLRFTGENVALKKGVESVLALDDVDAAAFDRLYIEVLKHFHESDETDSDNGLGNLALLDAATNRSYKNAVFSIKRRHILGLDKAGTFVPLCTKNVFLKCYSRAIDNMMFWSKEDGQAYREAIIDAFTAFFARSARGNA